jgi:DNA-binding CsgD family transcriptional regulator
MRMGPIVAGNDPFDVRVSRLSQGQLDCLRLVNEHRSSKEIAAELGISPHTVDQRIRGALAILGVERRSQAARVVASTAGPYQRLIYQAPDIGLSGPVDQPEGAAGIQIRHIGRTGGSGAEGLETEQRSKPRSSLYLPIATRSHPRNEMNVGLRLMWIVIIAIGATFSAGMYLAGLESLSRMMAP